MFRFFHTYDPTAWPAMKRLGWIGPDSGIRCMQHVFLMDDRKFNRIMAEESPLRTLLDETGIPIYFDRLQGGIFFDQDYRYDMTLFSEVKEKLGDLFWGFQIHEWASNLLNDWIRLEKAGVAGRTAWEIRETMCRRDGTLLPWLESRSAAEYAGLNRPCDARSLWDDAATMYRGRAAEFGGEFLLPCDSVFMAPGIEIASGARRLMPEVGWQIPEMRIQMAYTRGMARAAGIPFGVYYEPWGGEPFGVCSNRDGKNEWNLVSNGVWVFDMLGENGGSSRALQSRVLRYAYLSGASFVSEEWGLCNTFEDWHGFSLSAYGRVKDDFIRYVRDHPDVGEPITPIAIVLPKGMEVLDLWLYEGDRYLGFPLPEEEKVQARAIRNTLRFLFGNGDGTIGNEAHVIRNGGMPDAIDILHDGHDAALTRYEYLIDLTGDADFSKRHPNVIPLADVETTLRKTLPCWVEGGAHWMVNRTADGCRLTVMNHNGIERTVEHGERLLPGADLSVTISGVCAFRPEEPEAFPFRRIDETRLGGTVSGSSIVTVLL